MKARPIQLSRVGVELGGELAKSDAVDQLDRKELLCQADDDLNHCLGLREQALDLVAS